MSEPLPVLMVGCGAIAGGYDADAADSFVRTHSGAYLRDGRFRIAACIEPDATKRRAFMARWGVAKGYASLDECAADGAAFAVASVCAPTAAHEAILDRLLTMPVKVVFAEKPLTADIASARRIVATYGAAKRLLAVNHLRRWDPAMARLRDELASGQWGLLQSAVGHYAKGALNCGSHLIDLFRFLVGPLTPEAVFGSRDDFTPDDPTVDAILRTAQGAPVYLIGTDARAFFDFELELTADEGRIAIEEQGMAVRRRPAGPSRVFAGYTALDRGEWQETGLGGALSVAVANLHGAVTAGEALASDGASALAAQETCATLIAMAKRAAGGSPPGKGKR